MVIQYLRIHSFLIQMFAIHIHSCEYFFPAEISTSAGFLSFSPAYSLRKAYFARPETVQPAVSSTFSSVSRAQYSGKIRQCTFSVTTGFDRSTRTAMTIEFSNTQLLLVNLFATRASVSLSVWKILHVACE